MLDLIKDYLNKRFELVKLVATEKSSISAGIVAFMAVLLIAFTFFIILFNFGIAFLIGEALGNMSFGFLIVSGVYLLALVLVIYNRKKIIKTVANKVIEFLNQ